MKDIHSEKNMHLLEAAVPGSDLHQANKYHLFVSHWWCERKVVHQKLRCKMDQAHEVIFIPLCPQNRQSAIDRGTETFGCLIP